MTTGQLAFQGVADETSLSAGSSGGTGDTTTVQGVATGSVLHVDEDVQAGGYPYVRLDQASGSACTWRAAITPGASGQATGQFRFKTPASWASASHMIGYLTQTTGSQACRAVIGGTSSPGQVRLVNTSAATVVSSANNVLALSTEYVAELSCTPNAGSGTARLRIWNSDASSLLYDSGTQTSNFGTGALAYIGWGNASSTPTVATWYAGLARWADSITTWNGVSLGTPNIPPTVMMPANQNVAASAPVSAHASVGDPDGVVATTAWSVDAANSTVNPALSTPLDVTVGLTAPAAAGSLVTLDLDVTDDGGATTTGVTEVRVPITDASDTKPLAINSYAETGTWTKHGAQSTDGGTYASAVDTDYEDTAALSAVAQSTTNRLQPRSAISSGNLVVRASTGGDGTGHMTVTLSEMVNGVLVVRQVFPTVSLPNNTTPTDYTFALSSAAIAAIVDWGALYRTVAFTS